MRSPAIVLLAALALSSCATLPPHPGLSLALPPGRPGWTALAKGVDYLAFLASGPRVELYALRLDLDTPGLEPAVTPGEGGRTRSQYVSSFAREGQCLVAVNTNPFRQSSAVEGEARDLVGLSVADGRLVSPPAEGMAALYLRRSGSGVLRAEVGIQAPLLEVSETEASLVAAAGGFSLVLAEGEAQGGHQRREPRTAAGVSSDGRILYLLVADGRRRESAGLTDYEVGLVLSWLGAARGMTFDGGGSSALALRGADGLVRIANMPVEGGRPGRERAVGSCLGFRAGP